MSDRFELVPFEDHQIITIRNSGGIFVVMKPIVEALGLGWEAQRQRIQRHPVISKGTCITQVPSSGGMQEAVSLHLEHFHGWLVSLNPLNIKSEDRRAVIIRYQERAFRVIFEHFHGPITSQPGRSVTSLIALQNHTLRLIERLLVTRNRVERQIMYEMLTGMCRDLGIDAPALDQLGREIPPLPDIVQAFWNGIETLKARGVEYNHSRTEGLIALSLREIEQHFKTAGVKVEIDGPLRKALQQSESPQFVGQKAVNSAIHLRTKNCWVFAI